MKATIEQSRKSFTYQEKADSLTYKPFGYEKYKDYETKLTKEALVEYLLTQISTMEDEKREDVCAPLIIPTVTTLRGRLPWQADKLLTASLIHFSFCIAR